MIKVIFGILVVWGLVQFWLFKRKGVNRDLAAQNEKLNDLNDKEAVLDVREKVADRTGEVNKIETKVVKKESNYE
tara:strand:+ start:1401 stop:1625 length:225 start_codon:yes stop_codon:yes gene_type:complete